MNHEMFYLMSLYIHNPVLVFQNIKSINLKIMYYITIRVLISEDVFLRYMDMCNCSNKTVCFNSSNTKVELILWEASKS